MKKIILIIPIICISVFSCEDLSKYKEIKYLITGTATSAQIQYYGENDWLVNPHAVIVPNQVIFHAKSNKQLYIKAEGITAGSITVSIYVEDELVATNTTNTDYGTVAVSWKL
jgi:hypothetical protein